MESTARATITNGILAALPPDEYQRILPHLEPFDFEVGRVLYELEGPIDYMYFPYRALVSLVREMADGKVIEVGMVGKDGMTGLAFLMAEERSAERALVACEPKRRPSRRNSIAVGRCKSWSFAMPTRS
jgi:CRP-like cAMP-binding protein